MWIKASKLFYVLIVMYYGWYQVVFSPIPNMLLLLGSGMIYFILLHALQTKTNLYKNITVELKIWILFAFTSFVFGSVIAVNLGYLINSVFTFFQFLLLMFGIVYISNQDLNMDFFISVFILFAIICAITTTIWGIGYRGGRISMGLESNPNTLGITMAVGVCCILYKQDFNKLAYSIIAFIAILLLIYVCLLTGSRKSFISILFIIIYWFASVAFKDIKALRSNIKVKGIFAILLVIIAAYYLLVPYFNNSVLLTRLTSSLSDEGNENRIVMYIESYDIFMRSPIIGIGLNNYMAVSAVYKTYSHSTYAEALACTGIIGCILYFLPYIILLFKYGKMVRSKFDALLLKQARIMLCLLGMLFILGVGVIHFYSMTSSIAFGMIIAFYNINKNSSLKPHKLEVALN